MIASRSWRTGELKGCDADSPSQDFREVGPPSVVVARGATGACPMTSLFMIAVYAFAVAWLYARAIATGAVG